MKFWWVLLFAILTRPILCEVACQKDRYGSCQHEQHSGDEDHRYSGSEWREDWQEGREDDAGDEDEDELDRIILPEGPEQPQESILILDVAGADMGVPQMLYVKEYNGILALVESSRSYMKLFDESVAAHCKNEHESCGLWAILGECENNPNFMQRACAPLCKSCEAIFSGHHQHHYQQHHQHQANVAV